MKQITIVMPFLNEGDEPYKTIESIAKTAHNNLYDVIAIDDASDQGKSFVANCDNVKYIRNSTRMGVDYSRQLGVELSRTPYVFIIDAHMRFKDDNWMGKIINCLEKEPETIWCTTCLGLGYGTMDIESHKGKYYGANMLFVDQNTLNDQVKRMSRPAREVLEPKWASRQSGKEYEIPCVLGANYGFTKRWFDHIKGLKGLKMWGTSEPFLSMKSWMAGGKCKITTEIEIGHKFRGTAPYSTKISHLVYNKIFLCKTILPDDLGEKLINFLPKDVNFRNAMTQIEQDKAQIEEYRSYYQSIFQKSIYDYCEKFDINLP